MTNTHNNWDWSDDDNNMLRFFSQYQQEKISSEVLPYHDVRQIPKSLQFIPLNNVVKDTKYGLRTDIRINGDFFTKFSKGNLAERILQIINKKDPIIQHILYIKWIIQKDNSTLADDSLISSIIISNYSEDKWLKIKRNFNDKMPFEKLYEIYHEE